MAHKISLDTLARLQAQPSNIRNICILAHVDHGKTTLTDCLISSNGIISQKLAGRVRYMDSTEEEQLRGITMKSSAISLLHSDEPFRELRAAQAAKTSAQVAGQAVLGELTGSASGGATAANGSVAPARVPYLVNLIDSPGHVDFSMDVATAARLCDGALVVVDAVEGVCIQTHAVLRTAWAEGVRPVLLINKLDRLIVELQLSPAEAYSHLCRILEQANVILSELYMADLMASQVAAAGGSAPGGSGAATSSSSEVAAKTAAAAAAASGTAMSTEEVELTLDPANANTASPDDVTTFDATGVDVDERTEAALFFDPTKGNVIFASAFDGWAFTLDDFAGLHCSKLELPRALLRRALWGDYYYKPKTKKVVTGAAAAAAAKGKPLAVSLVWERLWAVYEAVQMYPDEARQAKIMSSLALDVPKRDLAVKDARMRLQAIMRAWLPVAPTVLGVVARKLPSPVEAQRARVAKLWPAASLEQLAQDLAPLPLSLPSPSAQPHTPDQVAPGMTMEQRLARVRSAIAACDASPDADCVVYISKMFSVPVASLPDLQGTFAQFGGTFPTASAPTPAEAWVGMGPMERPEARNILDLSPVNSSAQRSRHLRRKTEERRRRVAGAAAAQQLEGGNGDQEQHHGVGRDDDDDGADGEAHDDEDGDGTDGAETLIAFARVFSGVLQPDAPIFVLGPKYVPSAPGASDTAHLSQVRSPLPLYMMMGRELSPLLEARAGNVIGIGRLASHVLKTATLCTTPACVSLSPMTFQTTPLVRVAIEPREPRHLREVERGLALLNQADPCVELTVADNGELQLSALGELHLDRCLKDLVTRFARVEVSVSAPIISFQETLADGAKPTLPPPHVVAALRPAAAASAVPAGAAPGGTLLLLSPAAGAGAGGAGGTGAAGGALATATAWAPTPGAAAGTPHSHSSGGGRSLAFPVPPVVDEEGGGRGNKHDEDDVCGEYDDCGKHGGDPAAYGSHPTVLTAGFEFGKVYGGGAFPWSWNVPESGVSFHPPSASVIAHTPDRAVSQRLRALPLPLEVARFLHDSAPVLRSLAAEHKRAASGSSSGGGGAPSSTAVSSASPAALVFATRLRELCVAAGGPWVGYVARAWAFGPRRVGPNLLVGQPDGPGAAALARSLGLLSPGESVCDAHTRALVEGALGSMWHSVGLGNVLCLGGSGAELCPAPVHNGAAGAVAASAAAASVAGALGSLRSAIVQGFQLASSAGPLCGEPVWGVCFVVEEMAVRRSTPAHVSSSSPVGAAASSPAAAAAPGPGGETRDAPPFAEGLSERVAGMTLSEGRGGDGSPAGTELIRGGSATSGVHEAGSEPPSAAAAAAAPPPPQQHGMLVVSSGSVMAVSRDACRLAFQSGTQRLVEALFACELQCSGGRGGGGTGEQLGRLYGVLARRRGRVLREDIRDGTQTFEISALLPVVESFGFADDLRKQTSGAATSPQLVFSHWEVLEQDPFFRPQTEDERAEFGDTLHEGQGGRNIARGFVDAVRARKGMPVERKIVAHAEKQRTLSRKK